MCSTAWVNVSGAALTYERCDDVVHALQEAGQVLSGGVMGGGDLGHHGRRLGPGRLHAGVIAEDVGQTQYTIHLYSKYKKTTTKNYLPFINPTMSISACIQGLQGGCSLFWLSN